MSALAVAKARTHDARRTIRGLTALASIVITAAPLLAQRWVGPATAGAPDALAADRVASRQWFPDR
jgi:hypothetical protein